MAQCKCDSLTPLLYTFCCLHVACSSISLPCSDSRKECSLEWHPPPEGIQVVLNSHDELMPLSLPLKNFYQNGTEWGDWYVMIKERHSDLFVKHNKDRKATICKPLCAIRLLGMYPYWSPFADSLVSPGVCHPLQFLPWAFYASAVPTRF